MNLDQVNFLIYGLATYICRLLVNWVNYWSVPFDNKVYGRLLRQTSCPGDLKNDILFDEDQFNLFSQPSTLDDVQEISENDEDEEDDDDDYDIDECKVKGEAGSEPIEIKSNRKELVEEDEVKVCIY